MPSKEKTGKNIVLGVSGSIAAYKACSVLRGLMRKGYDVRVVMTDAAQQLIGPATFRALSGNPVATELWINEGRADLVHIRLAEWVDALAVVPATANIIGKVTAGIADEILSTTWMACNCPKVVAPAMNDQMWGSVAVQKNVNELEGRKNVHMIQPVSGLLASGKEARTGHLAPVHKIVETIDNLA
ncbi:MAG: flavoprotein [Planctomycetota bacterium]